MEKLNGLSVKQAIPSKHAHKFGALDSWYAVKYLPLALYRKQVQEDTKQMKLSIVKSGFDTRMDIVAAKMEKAVFYLIGDCVGNVRAYALEALSEIFKLSSEEKQQVIRNSLTLLNEDEDLQVQKLLSRLFI